jgi:hypothetical protein
MMFRRLISGIFVALSLFTSPLFAMDDLFGPERMEYARFRYEARNGTFDKEIRSEGSSKNALPRFLEMLRNESYVKRYFVHSASCLKKGLDEQAAVRVMVGQRAKAVQFKMKEVSRPTFLSSKATELVASVVVTWVDPIDGETAQGNPIECDTSHAL